MSFLHHDTTVPTRLNGIRLPESILGRSMPVIVGQQRISWLLGWYGDFLSKTAQTSGGGGGSGLGKSGNAGYVYSASVLGFLCMGPCLNFLGVWGLGGTGKYELDTYSETSTVVSNGSGGGKVTPVYSADFAQDAGVGYANVPYSVT